MKISRIQVKWAILLCSVSAYIISLFLPALLFEKDAPIMGGTLLAWGWWGFLFVEFAWLANPVYFFSISAYRKANRSITKGVNVKALRLSVIALLLGFTSYHAKFWYYDEGGNGATIIGLGIGFYVWMLSFLILLIGCFIPSAPPNEGALVS